MQKGIIITNLVEHNIVQFPVIITDHGQKTTVHDTVQVLGVLADGSIVEVNVN